MGAMTTQQAIHSYNFGKALTEHGVARHGSPVKELEPDLLQLLRAKGFKGLAPPRLRNWHRLASNLNTPGANITVVTLGGSITGAHVT
jgi:hypothetical protein